MDTYKRKELITGVVMLGIGLIYLFMTVNLPRRGGVDAAFVPYVLSAGLCVLGFFQLLASRTATPDPQADEPSETVVAPDYLTVLKTLGLIVIYTIFLESVGFLIMTALYLYLQFIVITPHTHRVNHLLYAAIAVISSAVIYVTFRQGFDLMLPIGLLDF